MFSNIVGIPNAKNTKCGELGRNGLIARSTSQTVLSIIFIVHPDLQKDFSIVAELS